MKKFNFTNYLKTRRFYLALAFFLPMFFIMCREQEKQAQRDKLDNQISNLNKKISEVQDLHSAQMPKNLHNTQIRYINASDSLYKNADTISVCMMQNEDLLMLAFNNYASRIGRDFQISKFLPQSDIKTFQKYISKLDSMDYIQEMARQRVLNNNGSLHDLSYFLELFDFDSINSELQNKLAWDFYTDSTVSDDEQIEVSTLCFADSVLNTTLRAETNLLNRAWRKNTLQSELNQNDSLRESEMLNTTDSAVCAQINSKYDSLQNQIHNEFDIMDEYTPNFSIPEFDSVRKSYMRNDSLINAYNKTADDMFKAEDTLIGYRQTMIRKRDSLIKERIELDR